MSYETRELMFTNPSKEELMQLMEQMHNKEHEFRVKQLKSSSWTQRFDEKDLEFKRKQLANKIIDAIRTNDLEYNDFLTKYAIGVGYDYIHIVAPNGVSFSFETDIFEDKPDLLYQFIKDNIKETYFEPEMCPYPYEKFLGSPIKLLNVNSGIGDSYRSYLAAKFSEFLPKDYLFEYKPGQFLHPETALIYSNVAEMNEKSEFQFYQFDVDPIENATEFETQIYEQYKKNARIYMEQQGYTQDQIDFVISENSIKGCGSFGIDQELIDAGLMEETNTIDPGGWRQAKDSLTFQFEDTLTQDTNDQILDEPKLNVCVTYSKLGMPEGYESTEYFTSIKEADEFLGNLGPDYEGRIEHPDPDIYTDEYCDQFEKAYNDYYKQLEYEAEVSERELADMELDANDEIGFDPADD